MFIQAEHAEAGKDKQQGRLTRWKKQAKAKSKNEQVDLKKQKNGKQKKSDRQCEKDQMKSDEGIRNQVSGWVETSG